MKEEEDAPTLVQAAAHAEPLVLLALVKSHHGMLVCAQLCDPQGAALLSFIHVPPRVPRPFAGAPVHSMTLTHVERLRAVGCGLKGKLAVIAGRAPHHHINQHINHIRFNVLNRRKYDHSPPNSLL